MENSAGISGTTSRIEPTNPASLSETQFLEQQRALARDAIARTWAQITSGLEQGVNPVEWTREYPFAAMGAAAIAGFIGACSLVPSKQQEALRKLAALERALSAPPPAADAPPVQSDKGPNLRRTVAGFMLEAIKVLQPVLISAISAKMASAQSDNGSNDRSEPPSAPPAPAE